MSVGLFAWLFYREPQRDRPGLSTQPAGASARANQDGRRKAPSKDPPFAFVAICSIKRERPVPWAMLEGGVLRVSWDAARRGRGGWGYAIPTFDRKEVKEVNRVELEPAQHKPEGPGK
jgi:hypothetical protein